MRANAREFAGLSASQRCHSRVSSTEASLLCRRTYHSAAARCVGSRSTSLGSCVSWLVIAVKIHMLTAVKQCPNHVLAHHALGDAESFCYRAGLEPVDLVHDEGCPALGRHGLDQGSQQPQRLLGGHLPLRRAVLRQLDEQLALRHLAVVLVTPAPIDRDVG